jgi:hypothetical protein
MLNFFKEGSKKTSTNQKGFEMIGDLKKVNYTPEDS